METTNREIIEKVNKGFEAGDEEAILKYIADDVRWDVPGAFTAIGKEEFRKNITNDQSIGTPIIKVTTTIAEGDYVAAEGSAQFQRKDGAHMEVLFFDLYRFKDGKIQEMRSYLVPKS